MPKATCSSLRRDDPPVAEVILRSCVHTAGLRELKRKKNLTVEWKCSRVCNEFLHMEVHMKYAMNLFWDTFNRELKRVAHTPRKTAVK
jgi:hypothetical protein